MNLKERAKKLKKDVPVIFLALKDKNGEYHWDNFDFVEKNVWSYTFDTGTILYEKIEKIGVAANNACGYAAVEILAVQIAK